MNAFTNREIFSIRVAVNDGPIFYIGDSFLGNIIGSIEDHGIEEDGLVFSLYWIKNKEGKILKVLENCPVDVTYREIEKE